MKFQVLSTRLWWVTAVALGCWCGVAVFGGCSKEDPDEAFKAMRAREDAMEAAVDTELSEAEMDTLRAWKKRVGVHKDLYWDDYGGVVANDYCEVWYPVGNRTIEHGLYVMLRIRDARGNFREIFGTVPEDSLRVKLSRRMYEFEAETGRNWWHYSRIDGDQIVYQPVPVLYQRRLLPIVIAREYYRWAIRETSGGRAPRWLEEGYPSLLVGEKLVLETYLAEFPADPVKMSFADIEHTLKTGGDKKVDRFAYYSAFQMTRYLVVNYGSDKIVEAVLAMGQGKQAPDAFEAAFGKPYEKLMAEALSFEDPHATEAVE